MLSFKQSASKIAHEPSDHLMDVVVLFKTCVGDNDRPYPCSEGDVAKDEILLRYAEEREKFSDKAERESTFDVDTPTHDFRSGKW